MTHTGDTTVAEELKEKERKNKLLVPEQHKSFFWHEASDFGNKQKKTKNVKINLIAYE